MPTRTPRRLRLEFFEERAVPAHPLLPAVSYAASVVPARFATPSDTPTTVLVDHQPAVVVSWPAQSSHSERTPGPVVPTTVRVGEPSALSPPAPPSNAPNPA